MVTPHVMAHQHGPAASAADMTQYDANLPAGIRPPRRVRDTMQCKFCQAQWPAECVDELGRAVFLRESDYCPDCGRHYMEEPDGDSEGDE